MSVDRDAGLKSFLESQNVSVLVAALLDLAEDCQAVRDRLARLQVVAEPVKLAAAFRRTLSAWQRSDRYIPYDESPAFTQELETWLKQIERELLPLDPAAALELAHSFVESDKVFFERADDSGGDIGSAIAAGCRLWLRAATRCDSPVDGWPTRIHLLASADEYGARDELLREAGMLLDANGLRELANLYEKILGAAVGPGTKSQSLPREVFAASSALACLSDALGDPDLRVRAVLAHSAEPNSLQMREFVQAYLRHGRPGDALQWLEKPGWQDDEESRQRLLAEALRTLDRRSECAAIRQRLFEHTLDVGDLRDWLDDLPSPDRPAAMQRARGVALRSNEPAAAAQLLLELGDDESAETVVLEGEARVREQEYTVLLPIARELDARERWRGATCVYRALLEDVLARGYAPAYSHAAKYWVRLQVIADRSVDLSPLQTHAVYAGQIVKRHSRKSRFWACVAEAGGRV